MVSRRKFFSEIEVFRQEKGHICYLSEYQISDSRNRQKTDKIRLMTKKIIRNFRAENENCVQKKIIRKFGPLKLVSVSPKLGARAQPMD